MRTRAAPRVPVPARLEGESALGAKEKGVRVVFGWSRSVWRLATQSLYRGAYDETP